MNGFALGAVALAALTAGLFLAPIFAPIFLAAAVAFWLGLELVGSQWLARLSLVPVGFALGFAPLGGVVLGLIGVALVVRDENRWRSLAFGVVLAAPMVLVSAALHETGWDSEAVLSLKFAKAILLAVWFPNAVDLRYPAGTAVGVFALAPITYLPPDMGQWRLTNMPHFSAEVDTAADEGISTPSGDGSDSRVMRQLLRLGAAGDRNAGYRAVGLWLRDHQADLVTLRHACPKHGFVSAWLTDVGDDTSRRDYRLGRLACESVEGLPEDGLRVLAQAEDPAFSALRAELRAETGVVDQTTPQWLRVILNRDDARPKNWSEFNRVHDFTTPTPARVRGIRSDGPGALLVSFAHDLDAFALTSVTKRGGFDFFATLRAPTDGQLDVLTIRGVSRRGLRLTLRGEGGELHWGCGLPDTQTQTALPTDLCEGHPGEARLHVSEKLRGALDSIVIAGEFALAYLHAEGEGS